jgi:hypothetical protein
MAKANFASTQYAFAAHIRDPEHTAAPVDIEPRRMTIYTELFFNNIRGTLSSVFPVIRSLFDDAKWDALVRDFMVKHACKTPLFVEIAREFLQYLEHERQENDDPVFLQELAHYEWVELALSVSEDIFAKTPYQEDTDLLAIHYVQSSLAWLLVYQYPVQTISAEHQPTSPSPVCLLVNRNEQDEVKFSELNPVSARLLERLSQQVTPKTAIHEIVTELNHPQPEVVEQGAIQMIRDWLNKGILLIQ